MTLYDRQVELVRSVWAHDETVCVAGNLLGKDFAAAYLTLLFFLTRSPCRIVTTSADYAQLSAVLWGEIRRFLQTSAVPLEAARGGPLVVNDLYLRRLTAGGALDPLSYVLGRTAAKGEGMLGHHVAKVGDGIPRTLAIADECSGVDDATWDATETWADRRLAIGNPHACRNFFRRAVAEGDRVSADGRRVYRKVLRIRAEDSPNVILGQELARRGRAGPVPVVLEGVLTWDDYQKRRALWPQRQQCVGLDARFWEGAAGRMFPEALLAAAARAADALAGRPRQARALGIDGGEGVADTAWAAVDDLGLIELEAVRTPDTSVIGPRTIALGRRLGVPATRWAFDRGGGGKQIADALRRRGHAVLTVPFGGQAIPDYVPRGLRTRGAVVGRREEQYAYRNRRAQMYFELRLLIQDGWAVPARFEELHRQLAAIPLEYDEGGRVVMLPKLGADGLVALLGRSPDEADAVALAVHALLHPQGEYVAGAV